MLCTASTCQQVMQQQATFAYKTAVIYELKVFLSDNAQGQVSPCCALLPANVMQSSELSA